MIPVAAMSATGLGAGAAGAGASGLGGFSPPDPSTLFNMPNQGMSRPNLGAGCSTISDPFTDIGLYITSIIASMNAPISAVLPPSPPFVIKRPDEMIIGMNAELARRRSDLNSQLGLSTGCLNSVGQPIQEMVGDKLPKFSSSMFEPPWASSGTYSTPVTGAEAMLGNIQTKLPPGVVQSRVEGAIMPPKFNANDELARLRNRGNYPLGSLPNLPSPDEVIDRSPLPLKDFPRPWKLMADVQGIVSDTRRHINDTHETAIQLSGDVHNSYNQVSDVYAPFAKDTTYSAAKSVDSMMSTLAKTMKKAFAEFPPSVWDTLW